MKLLLKQATLLHSLASRSGPTLWLLGAPSTSLLSNQRTKFASCSASSVGELRMVELKYLPSSLFSEGVSVKHKFSNQCLLPTMGVTSTAPIDRRRPDNGMPPTVLFKRLGESQSPSGSSPSAFCLFANDCSSKCSSEELPLKVTFLDTMLHSKYIPRLENRVCPSIVDTLSVKFPTIFFKFFCNLFTSSRSWRTEPTSFSIVASK